MNRSVTMHAMFLALVFLLSLPATAQVTLYNNQAQFEAATGTVLVPFPAPGASADCGAPSTTLALSYSVPFGVVVPNSLTVTGTNGNFLCMFDQFTTGIFPGNTNPQPVRPTVVGNGEDDYTVEFDVAVNAVGIELLTNFSAIETITLKDGLGNVIGVPFVFSPGSVPPTPVNTFVFLGFKSVTPIKSVLIDTTNGASQNEGISALKLVNGNGCSHGFFKSHTDAYTAPYTPTTTLGSVFTGVDASLASKTFADALSFGGGPGVVGAQQNLLRQAVAALLNAVNPSIKYSLSAATVISQVNSALGSGDRGTILAEATLLETYNTLGCPLS